MAVHARAPKHTPNTVFLNIPYDEKFRPLYLAYIAGLTHLGLTPRATLEIPGGQNRLDKIIGLIRSCHYSIHDLSRIEVDRTYPRTPRFNMPFELGLAVALATLDRTPGNWFVFEAKRHRLSKSLSDLSGTDPHIHEETTTGIMRELGNAFVRRSSANKFSVQEMMKTFRAVSLTVAEIERQTGSRSLFEARAFRLLCTAARKAAGVGRSDG